MIKTMPKAAKAFCLLILITVIAMVGWSLLSADLLVFSEKAAAFFAKYLSAPASLPQDKIYKACIWAYYILCAALYCFILWTIKTFTAWLWKRRLTRVGLKNPQNETPRLRTIKKHKNKIKANQAWIVYRFVPFGFSDEDFRQKSARLVGIFRGRVGECSFSDNRKYIEVEVLPWRKIVPAIFQLFDSTERRQDLMNILGVASLIVGVPNGGKTYCMLTLAANYAAEGYTIVWLNRKGADVDEFRECLNYFEADEVAAGWKEVFERLRLRERHEESEAEKQQKFLLVFDEYQSHVARRGKEKTAFLQEFMTYIAMSRSLGFKTLIGTQAAYAEDMPKGARDMFANIAIMGNAPKTQKAMYLEADMIEQLAPVRQQGGGNIYHAADNSVEKIVVAPMADKDAVTRLIVDALNRPIFLSQVGEEDIPNTP